MKESMITPQPTQPDVGICTSQELMDGVSEELNLPSKHRVTSETFFSEDHRIVRIAKEVCNLCPIQPTCLDNVLQIERTSGPVAGVAGGLNPEQRVALRAMEARRFAVSGRRA